VLIFFDFNKNSNAWQLLIQLQNVKLQKKLGSTWTWFMRKDGRSTGHGDENVHKNDENAKNANDEAGSDDGHVICHVLD
jgi:hypothetical protein